MVVVAIVTAMAVATMAAVDAVVADVVEMAVSTAIAVASMIGVEAAVADVVVMAVVAVMPELL